MSETGMTFIYENPPPNAEMWMIQIIHKDGSLAFGVRRDGKIEVGDKDQTENAKRFIELLADMIPQYLRKPE